MNLQTTQIELPLQSATLEQIDETASHSTKPATGDVTGYLQQAIIDHQAGRLQEAERLYRAILQVQPNHPDANHNLGVLAVQVKQVAAGLPYFKLAFETDPGQAQFWLSYIDALIQCDQIEAASQILQEGRQRGLQGDAVEALLVRVHCHALPDAPVHAPEPYEIHALVSLFKEKQYSVAAQRARVMTEYFPEHEFGWKMLSAALKQMGRNANAVTPMLKSAKLSPQDVEVHYNLGNVLQELGRSDEAVASYRRALEIKPDYAEAYYNIGTVQQSTGQLDDAVRSYREALKIKPDYAKAYNNLGDALQKSGQLDAALLSFRQALKINPDYAEAYCNLGNTLQELGQLDEALAYYRRALEIKPEFAEAHCNLGNVLQELGQLEHAVESYRSALLIRPEYAEAHYNLGIVLEDLSQPADAVVSYRRALEIKPDFAEAYSNLGNALRGLGQFHEAVMSCCRALDCKPDFAVACSNLGNAQKDLGQLDEAVASYRRALELKPDLAMAHNNLGASLKDMNQLDGAMACFRQALEIKPDFVDAHSNLGTALQDSGRSDEAAASHRRALALQPLNLQHAIHAHLILPIFPDTIATVDIWRKRYLAGIKALMDEPGSLDEPGINLNTYSFFLAYHNYNDRAVMNALRHFFRGRQPELSVVAPHISGWKAPEERRIRVGFLSEFLVEHTIGKLYQGIIHQLDRSRFEVLIIHTAKAKQDVFSQKMGMPADKVITLPARLKEQQQAVMDEQLDVLFYPDIGMATSTYFLAYARLAPVQAVSWGHPDSSGLDTLDYFISAASIEPENAAEHYTERLIRLNRLPCFYQPLIAPAQIPNRATLGLPETGTLYGCPQSLFKFHPDFDGILAAIAEGDPDGKIVLLEGVHSAWTEQLKARWQTTAPVLMERVLFLGRMSMERFMALITHMDVLLDPIHFGSGNTLYEAMVYGTPVVTWPGQFMRGRIVAGAYWQMGVSDAPVAQNLEDYVQLALAFGRDPARRHALREASREAAKRELFADEQAVREFEHFLEDAVAAAGTGDKLAPDWRPDIRSNQTIKGILV